MKIKKYQRISLENFIILLTTFVPSNHVYILTTLSFQNECEDNLMNLSVEPMSNLNINSKKIENLRKRMGKSHKMKQKK